jgi:hypothetical protein
MSLPLAVLDAVEALPADARGALVVSSDSADRGAILVEHNRVCWASAIGLEHRLRELLQEHSGWRIDDRGIERVVEVSRGRAFLTELVAKGLVPKPGIHAALRQHSIESLIALCGLDAAEIRWVSRERPLGAPTSFEPTDLLAGVGARLYSSEAETAKRGVVRPHGASGASFAIGDDDELVVVGEVSGERLGVCSLLELGGWAAAALDATPGFTPAMIERAIANVAHSVAVGWRSARRVVHALVVENRPALEHTVDTMRQMRVPIVVSVCIPWKLKDSVIRDAPGAAF